MNCFQHRLNIIMCCSCSKAKKFVAEERFSGLPEGTCGTRVRWFRCIHCWQPSWIYSIWISFCGIWPDPRKSVTQTSSVPGKNKTNVQELDLITTDSRGSCQTWFSFPVFYELPYLLPALCWGCWTLQPRCNAPLFKQHNICFFLVKAT